MFKHFSATLSTYCHIWNSLPQVKGPALVSKKKVSSVLRASVWSTNKGDLGPQAPPLDLPLHYVTRFYCYYKMYPTSGFLLIHY